MPGIAWVMMSSRLGLVAEVMATESPSQLSPVVIHKTWAVTASVFLCCSILSMLIRPPSTSLSTDPRQRVAHQLVHHPLAAKTRLHQHHRGRLRPYLSDLRGVLAARHRAQRGKGVVRGLRCDEGHELALVRDVHRVDSEDLGRSGHG